MKTVRLFKNSLILLCLLVFAFPLWGDYYYTDDPEMLNLIHICRRMGKVLPFSSFPVHGSDILDFADFLLQDKSASRLNETDRALLEELIDGFEKQRKGEIILKGALAAAYEHRFSAGAFTIEGEEVPNAIDVHRAYLDFSPVLGLDAAVGTFKGIWIAGRFELRPSWENDYSPMNNFFTKVDINYDIVNKGILAWNGKYVNLSVSRNSVHWGNPQGSTLYPSALLPHLDHVDMNVPLGPFSFDYMFATVMPKRSKFRDVDSWIDRDYPFPEYPVRDPKNPLGDYFGFLRDRSDVNPSVILMAAHRLQWNFGRVKAGVGGTIVYARSNNQFLVTDFLPVIVYHNSDSVPNNLALLLDAEWLIVPGLSLSLMVGFDDINAQSFGLPDGQIPTIPGAVLQLEYSLNSKKIFQSYLLETGYTHYLWGNFAYTDDPKEWYGVHLARAIYRYTPDKYAVLLPLTSPYGPGSLWGKLKADIYFHNVNIHAGADFLFLAKKEGVNLVDTPYKADNALNSFDLFYFSLDLPVSYTLRTKAGALDFTISPAFLWGTEGTAFECTLGIKWSMKGSRFFSIHRKAD